MGNFYQPSLRYLSSDNVQQGTNKNFSAAHFQIARGYSNPFEIEKRLRLSARIRTVHIRSNYL